MPESIAEFCTNFFRHMVNKITVYQSTMLFTYSYDVEIEA